MTEVSPKPRPDASRRREAKGVRQGAPGAERRPMISDTVRKILGLSPALPPPVNSNDGRLPVHSAQQAFAARLAVETALRALAAAEARWAKILRQQLRVINGDGP